MKFEPFSFDKFPSYDAEIEGVIEVQGDEANIKGRIVDVENQKGCIIRFLFPESALMPEKKYPLIVHIQGSGWYSQDMGDHVLDFFPIVKQGFAFAIIQYHGTPNEQFPTQIIDAKRALRFIEKHAEDYPIEPAQIFLSGDSSGGNVAMLTALTYNTYELDEETTPLPKLCGCMDFYGVMDLLAMDNWWSAFDHEEEHNIRDFLGADYMNPQVRKEASPYWRLEGGMELPPVLILHGSKDAVVPFTQSLAMYEKMRDYGYDVSMMRVYGANHGGPIFYCENTCQAVINFLRTHLGM